MAAKNTEAKSFWSGRKIALIILALVVLIFVIVLPIGVYNTAITNTQNIASKWSEVENQYQRQADLIPNLVSVVSSYVGYESGLLNNLTALRSQWQSQIAGKNTVALDQTGVEMTSSLARLIAVAENYPQLKANTQYTALSDELSGSQNRIATARGRYIEAVQAYNTGIKTFPANIYAGMFGFSEKDYYKAEGALTTPSVGSGTTLP